MVCLLVGGCERHRPKSPDPTKGVVTGTVFCADTGEPARLATVILTAAPGKNDRFDKDDPVPAAETAQTDLHGRFRMEAVKPGRYFAFATLDGYLNPRFAIDLERIEKLPTDAERILEAQREWKDQMVEVTVAVQRTTGIAIRIKRAAEIDGTVTFDDGSPAIGVNFRLFRKTDTSSWTGVGVILFGGPAVPVITDSRGHYAISSLPAGEYIVCAVIPDSYNDEAGLTVCNGNVFRRRNAELVKATEGEALHGVDIEVPLTNIYRVDGTVTSLSDGRPLSGDNVQLLYADNKEKVMSCKTDAEGAFVFPYVHRDSYIVEVGSTEWTEEAASDDSGGTPPPKRVHHFKGKEVPLDLQSDMTNVDVALPETPPRKPAAE